VYLAFNPHRRADCRGGRGCPRRRLHRDGGWRRGMLGYTAAIGLRVLRGSGFVFRFTPHGGLLLFMLRKFEGRRFAFGVPTRFGNETQILDRAPRKFYPTELESIPQPR
jgi:hypothetical protein